MLPYSTVTPKESSTKTIRITQQHGSMEGKKVLEAVKEKMKEIEVKENKKLESQKERDNQKEMFLKCKEDCQCKDMHGSWTQTVPNL